MSQILSGPIMPPMQKPKSYLDEFDPNNTPDPYATYTHGRNPHFKLHRGINHVTSAMNNNKASGCIAFEHKNGQWVEIARFEPNTWWASPDKQPWVPKRCERCHAPTIQFDQRRQEMRQQGEYHLARNANGKLIKPLVVEFLCPTCY